MNDYNKSFFLAFNEMNFPTATAQEKQYANYVADGKMKTKVYLTENARRSKQNITEALWIAINKKGWTPKDAIPKDIPIQLKTEWYFPIPKNKRITQRDSEMSVEEWKEYLKKQGKIFDGQWKTTKPDTDNLVKSLKDIMTHSKVFWDDDAQVCAEIITKRYASVPGIYITVCPMGKVNGIDYGNDMYVL